MLVQPWYAIALFEGTLGSDGNQLLELLSKCIQDGPQLFPVDITNLSPISLNTGLLVYVDRSK